MARRGQRLSRALLTGAALAALSAACGQVSDSSNAPRETGSGGSAGADETGPAGGSAGADETGPAGAIDPAAVALDTSDCALRAVSDCQGVKTEYSSDNAVFDEAPALAQCSRFNSWDGCQSLAYTFDAEGCATSVAARGAGASDVLPELRRCLSAALAGARWPCLARGTLRYDESCFIR